MGPMGPMGSHGSHGACFKAPLHSCHRMPRSFDADELGALMVMRIMMITRGPKRCISARSKAMLLRAFQSEDLSKVDGPKTETPPKERNKETAGDKCTNKSPNAPSTYASGSNAEEQVWRPMATTHGGMPRLFKILRMDADRCNPLHQHQGFKENRYEDSGNQCKQAHCQVPR